MTKPEWWTSDHWSTPPEFVAKCEAEFGKFDTDPCCMTNTAKAPTFYTPEQDGLKQEWYGKVWLNPPYSNPTPWLKKAHEEVSAGRAELVVALIPSSTETGWFHDWVIGKAEIRFLRGRIRFFGWMGTPIGSPRQGNVLAIYRRAQ